MPSSQQKKTDLLSFVDGRQFPNTSALHHPRDVRDSTTLCMPVPVALDRQAIKDHRSHILRVQSSFYPIFSNDQEESDLVLYDNISIIQA